MYKVEEVGDLLGRALLTRALLFHTSYRFFHRVVAVRSTADESLLVVVGGGRY